MRALTLCALMIFVVSAGSVSACPSSASLAVAASAAAADDANALIGDVGVPVDLAAPCDDGMPQGGGEDVPAPKRVIHVWVDPHYGVDNLAATNNPRVISPGVPNNGCSPITVSTWKPNDELDTTNSQPLLHAPWPFKTITAALAYIPSLPYASPVSNVVWEYAIIHLMPGKYSRSTTQDGHNGLYGNGETVPIRLPNRVSIQGTNAINTVFDLEDNGSGGSGGPAFEFGTSASNAGEGSFINRVSIFGATSDVGEPPSARPQQQAFAIHLAADHASKPTITNCMIYGNGGGILIDAPDNESAWHEPVIVSNTIAMNDVGIWNGQIAAGNSSVGVSHLICYNNIFDRIPPYPLRLTDTTTCQGAQQQRPFPASWLFVDGQLGAGTMGRSCFEGVDAGDVTMSSPATVDYNAYQASGYNLGVAVGFAFTNLGLPTTGVRAGSPSAPGVDIGPIVGSRGDRGILYVRDLLHNGSDTSRLTTPPFFVSCDFDQSPGDFRLAPATAPYATDPTEPGTSGALNLLVDQGYDGDFSTTSVTMGNGLVLSTQPGTLDLGASQASWPYSSLEEDCEGFGNPRSFDHPVYSNGSGGVRDIGAHELGVLLEVGRRFGTSHYMVWNQAPGRIDNRFLWLLGPPDALSGTTPNSARPWFSHMHESYAVLPWVFGPPSTYYLPNNVDVMPHLLPDVHPLWVPAVGGTSNPLWESCVYTVPQLNAFLYQDPVYSVINPPGTHTTTWISTFNWIDGLTGGNPGFAPAFWAAYFGMAAPQNVTNFGTWCQNTSTTSTVDYDDVSLLPNLTPGLAQRYSIEFMNDPTGGTIPFGNPTVTGGSNLATFMVLVEDDE